MKEAINEANMIIYMGLYDDKYCNQIENILFTQFNECEKYLLLYYYYFFLQNQTMLSPSNCVMSLT